MYEVLFQFSAFVTICSFLWRHETGVGPLSFSAYSTAPQSDVWYLCGKQLYIFLYETCIIEVEGIKMVKDCYELNCVLQNLSAEPLTLKVALCGDKIYKGIRKVK